MDVWSFSKVLLSSNDPSCREPSRQNEEIHGILIDMEKETGDLMLIQALLGTKVHIRILQTNNSVFPSLS